eukprot:TRINITY_DN4511_c0_g1_i1.p1 TRINITY_DN4511_c0_g1~~TRINITY_DN4511_c0_g1_i1.p1  ORF type:complete len:772 (-),score=299.57 TRINITY_DN4511_c0_g1_i1:63-2204(-)
MSSLVPTREPSFAGGAAQAQSDVFILPSEVLMGLLVGYVSPTDLLSLSAVCRGFRSICSQPTLWKNLLKKKFPSFYERLVRKALSGLLSNSMEPFSPILAAKPGSLDRINWKGEFFQRKQILSNWKNQNYNLTELELNRGGITCLEFGENYLITGSSDSTVRVIELRPSGDLTLPSPQASPAFALTPNIGAVNSPLYSNSNDRLKHSHRIRSGLQSNSCSDYSSRSALSGSLVGLLAPRQPSSAGNSPHNPNLSSGSNAKSNDQSKSLTRSHNGIVMNDKSKLRVSSGGSVMKPKTLGVPIPTSPTGSKVAMKGSFPDALIGKSKLPEKSSAVSDIDISNIVIPPDMDLPLHDWNVFPRYLFSLQCGSEISCMAMNEKRRLVVVGGIDGKIQMWSFTMKNMIRSFEGHSQSINAIAFDDHNLVSASSDNTLRLYDNLTGESVELKGHTGPVTQVIMDDLNIVSGSSDGTVRLWNRLTKSCTHIFQTRSSAVTFLLSLPSFQGADYILASGEDGEIHALRTSLAPHSETGDVTARKMSGVENIINEAVFVLKGHQSKINAMKLEGETLISCSNDKTVVTWDLSSKSKIWSHTASLPVKYLDACSDNKILVFATDQNFNATNLFEEEKERELFVPQHNDLMWNSCLKADETLVVLGSTSGKVTILDFSPRVSEESKESEDEIMNESPIMSTSPKTNGIGKEEKKGGFSGLFKKKK